MSLKWFFPSTEDELVELLDREGIIVHGGGTAIPKGRLVKADSVVDLSHMGWNFCENRDDSIDLGAMATFSQVVRFMRDIDEGHILVRSLSKAASTAQRNRITVGGSVAFSPLWSDLIGPLVALNSSVELLGYHSGTYPLMDYISKKSLFKGSVIKKISIPNDVWQSWYYREVRVGFDYPGFTVTLMSKKNGDLFKSLKAVVVGTKERVSVLRGLEEDLSGKRVGDIDITGLADSMVLSFPDKKSGSGSYFEQVAPVWIERGLEDLLER